MEGRRLLVWVASLILLSSICLSCALDKDRKLIIYLGCTEAEVLLENLEGIDLNVEVFVKGNFITGKMVRGSFDDSTGVFVSEKLIIIKIPKDYNANSFNWGGSCKVELQKLKEKRVIFGLPDTLIRKICSKASASLIVGIVKKEGKRFPFAVSQECFVPLGNECVVFRNYLESPCPKVHCDLSPTPLVLPEKKVEEKVEEVFELPEREEEGLNPVGVLLILLTLALGFYFYKKGMIRVKVKKEVKEEVKEEKEEPSQ